MRVVELRARGLTYEQIAHELGVCSRTVIRDMQSVDVKKFVEELVRRQLEDIEGADEKSRLRYRDYILDKLMPKRVEAKTETRGVVEYKIVIKEPKLSGELGSSPDPVEDT